MPPRNADNVSSMCSQGKHGRCGGWMVRPNFRNDAKYPDISVRCRCPECNHPAVDPERHIKEPPKGSVWST